MKKRVVILLGAGSTVAWKAATTADITNKIISCKEFTTEDGMPLGEFIQKSISVFHECDINTINFEHILNTLENLVTFYYQKSNEGTSPDFVGTAPIWFTLSEKISTMLNYSFTNNINNDGYCTLINKSNSIRYENVSTNFKEGSYFSKAIRKYLWIIETEIYKYDANCLKDEFKELNDTCSQFYEELKNLGYIVRFYTTNYDNLFPAILKKKFGHDCLFNGFNFLKTYENTSNQFFLDSKKILNDVNKDVYYNLHGSIYWEHVPDFRYYDYTYTFSEDFYPKMDKGTMSKITNPKEFTSIYPIVTGFNKLQKVSIEPLRSFFSSLSLDCSNADLILTVGYSFGDPHINGILRNGIIGNDSNYFHITKATCSYLESIEYLRMQADVLNRRNRIKESISSPANWLFSDDKKQGVFFAGFQDFLKNCEYNLIIS